MSNAASNPLPENVDDWPEEVRSAYEERAAILEFDAGLPRAIAERKARILARLAHNSETA